MGGGLDMAGNGAQDFVGGDVGPTVSRDFRPGAGQDSADTIDFVGNGRKDLFGGKTGSTEQGPDEGTPSGEGGNVIDFPGKGQSDTGYKHY